MIMNECSIMKMFQHSRILINKSNLRELTLLILQLLHTTTMFPNTLSVFPNYF